MRNQTENRSSGAHTRTRLKSGARERTCNQTENGSSRVLTETGLKPGGQEHTREPGAAGDVRSANDRDVPALEARTGRVAVGCTSQEPAGVFCSTNRNRIKVARRAQWRADCDLSVLRQRLGYGHCCSDSQKSHRKLPGKAAKEQKPGRTGLHCAHPHPPSQGTGRLYPNRVA